MLPGAILDDEVEAAKAAQAEPLDQESGCLGHLLALDDAHDGRGPMGTLRAEHLALKAREDFTLPAGDRAIRRAAFDEAL
jgi:hypothetical protein